MAVIYLAIGAAALAALLWMGGRRSLFGRREWRILSGALAIAAFAAAAYMGMRGGWSRATVLGVVGLWLASTARTPPQLDQRGASKPSADLGEAEARSILGVGPEAGSAEIQAAYSRLMRVAHPDRGGSDGLAAQLNAARDRLLKR